VAGSGEAAGSAEVVEEGDAEDTEEFKLLFEFWIACCWATKVVDAAGQPTPAPLRFCSVTMAAWMRVSAEALVLSVGNDTATEGLLTAFLAKTLAFRD
jgi:hypothetical protein